MLHCHLPTHQSGKSFPKTMPEGKQGSPTPPFKVPRATKGQAQQRGAVGFGRGKTHSPRRGEAQPPSTAQRDAKGRPDPVSFEPVPLRAARGGQAAKEAARRRAGGPAGAPHSLEDSAEAALPPQLGEALEPDGIGLLEGAEQLLAVRLQPRHRAHPAAAPLRAHAQPPHNTPGAPAQLPRARVLPVAGRCSLGSSVRERDGPVYPGAGARPRRRRQELAPSAPGAAVLPAPRRGGEPGRQAQRPAYPSAGPGEQPGEGGVFGREGAAGGFGQAAAAVRQPQGAWGCRWGARLRRSPPRSPQKPP